MSPSITEQHCSSGNTACCARAASGHAAAAPPSNLLEELQPFASDLRAKDGVPSDIASGPVEARYEPGPHWIMTQAVLGGEVHDARAVVQEQAIRQHEERTRPLPNDCHECDFDLFPRAYPQRQHFHSQHQAAARVSLLDYRVMNSRRA
jgi:hypothetical protein